MTLKATTVEETDQNGQSFPLFSPQPQESLSMIIAYHIIAYTMYICIYTSIYTYTYILLYTIHIYDIISLPIHFGLFMSLDPSPRPKPAYGVPFQPNGWHEAQVKPLAWDHRGVVDTGFTRGVNIRVNGFRIDLIMNIDMNNMNQHE